MAYTFRKQLVSKDKYSLKCPLYIASEKLTFVQFNF